MANFATSVKQRKEMASVGKVPMWPSSKLMGVILVFVLGVSAQSKVTPELKGVWKAAFADSLLSGTTDFALDVTEGTVSGTYKASSGGQGKVSGKLEGQVFSFVLSQAEDNCPATYVGKITITEGKGTGSYSGTSCLGKHENGVVSMWRESVGVEKQESAAPTQMPAEVIAERQQRNTECPRCRGVLLYYVDADTSARQKWWLTEDQRKWLEKERKDVQKNPSSMRLWFTQHEANADYLIFWTEAEGSRPYVYYVPRVETETARVSGNYNTFGSGGSTWGTFGGTVQVQRTVNQRVEGERNYVDVVMVVYDARSGQKLYETWHQGNWLWSKPWKDCLVDTIRFLRQGHP